VKSVPTLAMLIDAGLLAVGDHLLWNRPRSGDLVTASIVAGGLVRIEDGRQFDTPSRAAQEASKRSTSKRSAVDGWTVWRVERLGGVPLADVRRQYRERFAT
jgi:hypothetical protein